MSKRFSLLVIFYLCFVLNLPAQDFLWVQHGGEAGGSAGHSLKVDAQGNSYVTGNFSSTLSFCSVALTSYGDHDIFVAKFAPDGKPLWIRQAGGSGSDTGDEIIIDDQGNAYVTGTILGRAKFGDNTFIQAQQTDVFLAKYSPEGKLLWVTSGGGSGFDSGKGLALDNAGNIYLGGQYENEIAFGNLKVNGGVGFLAAFTPAGSIQSVQSLGDAIVSSLAIDNNQNLFLAGSYAGAGTFINATAKSVGGRDLFLTKWNLASRQIEWTKVGGSVLDETAMSVEVDAAGNSYVAGINMGSLQFGNQQIGYLGGFTDIFISKIAPDGKVLWLKNAGGNDEDTALKLAYSKTGDILITGLFTGKATFGNKVLTSEGKGDIYAAQYDESGNLRNVYHVKGADKEKSMGIASNAAGNIWMTGTIGFTAQFGPLKITPPNNFTQLFVAKIGLGTPVANVCTPAPIPNPEPTPVPPANFRVNIPNIITPNADGKNDYFAINIQTDAAKEVNLTIYNRWGKKVLEERNYLNTWAGNSLPPAVYYYTAEILLDGKPKTVYKGWVELVH